MIEIRNLNLSILGKKLLENVNLNFYEGHIHLLMGESGSGKTTLLNEIGLLANISVKQYIWNGIEIDNLKQQEKGEYRRINIGYMLQDLELISDNLSVEDNIKCMFSLTGQAYDQCSVDEYMGKLQLNIPLDQYPQDLSRGEKQRLALLLALIKNADLIICDEPTSSLDIVNSKLLMQCLKTIAKEYNKIIIIATHDKLTLDYADIIYQIENYTVTTKKQSNYQKQGQVLKETLDINKKFFKIFKQRRKNIREYITNLVYISIITLLCVAPVVLDNLVDKQQQLYEIYDVDELFISFSDNYQNNNHFSLDTIEMLKEIEHIKNADYYYEVTGLINDNIEVVLRPKFEIQEVRISGYLHEILGETPKLELNLNNNDIDSNIINVDNYEVRENNSIHYQNKEVIEMPYDIFNELLIDENVKANNKLLIQVDDTDNLEQVSNDIKRWMNNDTIIISGDEHVVQIETLENLYQYLAMFRYVIVFILVIIGLLFQVIKNKDLEREIMMLRINGFSKNSFYQLCIFENIDTLFLSISTSLISYFCCTKLFILSFDYVTFLNIGLKCAMYTIMIKLIILIYMSTSMYSKDISIYLRNDN